MGAAQGGDADQSLARAALEELCRSYWYPIYAFVRRRGHPPHDAQDLTQSFLARFIETGGFAGADRERGRFRTYLLGALKHFLANEWHRARRQKRGGGVRFLEWDALAPEARYALEPCQPPDAERHYDREWARELTGRTLETLRTEWEAAGKGELFAALHTALSGEEPSRGDTARRLGLSEGALKVAIHRLRRRYRDLLRAEIAGTVADAAEVEDEMRHLVAALRAPPENL
ncbi:MAG: sigma-70 family RNA polymerase sigma factor [Verrucomicrobiales bacterium]|nr:sigma-70 family RNA polymerase sigma factor [Verrucomicrobiales bacterium]MCP5525805.1 sigma-70 family RNA polymerase sigma factor [Verrucomicrobiales bacterium]